MSAIFKKILLYFALVIAFLLIQNGSLVYYAELPAWKIIIRDVILMLLGGWSFQAIDSNFTQEIKLSSKLIMVTLLSLIIIVIISIVNWLLGITIVSIIKYISYNTAVMMVGSVNVLILNYIDADKNE